MRKRIRYVCIVFFWATNFSLMSSDPCMTKKKNYDIVISIQDIYIYICNIIKYNCITIITFIGILNSWISTIDIIFKTKERILLLQNKKEIDPRFEDEVAKENIQISKYFQTCETK